MPPVCGFRLATAQPAVRAASLGRLIGVIEREGPPRDRTPRFLCEERRKKRDGAAERTVLGRPAKLQTRGDIIAHLPGESRRTSNLDDYDCIILGSHRLLRDRHRHSVYSEEQCAFI